MEKPRPRVVSSNSQKCISQRWHLDRVTTHWIRLAFRPDGRIHGRVVGCYIEGFMDHLEFVAVEVAGQ